MEHVPRRVARWLVLPLVLAASAVVWATPAEASQALGDHAAARGKFFGAALNPNLLNNTSYRNIAATEFNQITPENHMKWDTVQPNQGQFNFSGADQVVNFAQQNGQEVHGHTLVWHSQTAGWVQGLNGTQMRTAMQNHINALVGRYASNPTVVSWDVVNEPLEENGQPRSSFWNNAMGFPGYIDDAFRFARAADGNATLCINDFNIDGLGTKSNAYFTLVQGMLSRGVPIDCIGFQGHLAVQFGFPNQVQQNLQRFANLGLEVRITELDVRIPLPADSNELSTQNTYYTNMINACLAVSACSGVTVWGVDDGNSWVPGVFGGEGDALLWNAQFQAKAVYNVVHNVLAGGRRHRHRHHRHHRHHHHHHHRHHLRLHHLRRLRHHHLPVVAAR